MINFWGCAAPKANDIPCSPNQLYLEKPTTTATQLGSAQFNVAYHLCNYYATDTMWLVISTPSGGKEYETITAGSFPSWDGTHTFTHNLSQVERYEFWVCLGGTTSNPKITSEHNTVEIVDNTKNIFKIIELEMWGIHDDILWPNDAANSYVATAKRDNAFAATNTIINVSKHFDVYYKEPNGSFPDLSTYDKIYTWALKKAYGDDLIGVDPKVSILCAIDDFSSGYWVDPEGAYTSGLSWPADPGHTFPPVSFILNNRIRANNTVSYDKVRIAVGTAIHELGHNFGIYPDDPNITHTDPNAADCVMHSPNPASRYTNPLFCGGHLQFISTQTWFK